MAIVRTNPTRVCRAEAQLAKNADFILAKTKPIACQINQASTTFHVYPAPEGKDNFWVEMGLSRGHKLTAEGGCPTQRKQ